MKRIIILLLFFGNSLRGYSQNDSVAQADTSVYTIADELPSYVGGDSALSDYINKNFTNSKKIREQGIDARTVGIAFIVTSDGKIKDVHSTGDDVMASFAKKTSSIISGEKATTFENELLEVLESMPDWKPGKLNGKPVNFKYLLKVYVDLGTISGNRHVNINNLSQITFLRTKADNAYERGVKKSQEKDYQGAIDDFTEALKYGPNDIDALFNRAVMKFKLKDTEGACADWNSIKALGKNDADEQLKKYCEK